MEKSSLPEYFYICKKYPFRKTDSYDDYLKDVAELVREKMKDNQSIVMTREEMAFGILFSANRMCHSSTGRKSRIKPIQDILWHIHAYERPKNKKELRKLAFKWDYNYNLDEYAKSTIYEAIRKYDFEKNEGYIHKECDGVTELTKK